VKNILIGAIIFILISLQVNGQQPQDTLYLKNGSKAAGKLLEKSKTEYRFQTSDNVIWTFSPDEVEKLVPATFPVTDTTRSLIMRNVILDTLSIDELNLYKDKASKMRHTGMILTSCGVGIVAASYIVGVMIGENPSDDTDGTWSDYSIALGVIGIGGTIGIAAAIVGVPLWLTGGSRKAKAELTLQKFNIAPENSMALGLGITIRF
jgi:hypothetical protein